MGFQGRVLKTDTRVETRVLKILACRNGFWTSLISNGRQRVGASNNAHVAKVPLNIRIQWNAGTACVSECVLKTLACRGLRVGPSKCQPTVENLPKARHGSGGFFGGFLQWIFGHKMQKKSPPKKKPPENPPAETKHPPGHNPPEIHQPDAEIHRQSLSCCWWEGQGLLHTLPRNIFSRKRSF